MCLRSFFTRRSHPATFPHTASFRCPPYRQQATTCLPVRTRATRGRLRSSTRPNLDAHETGRAHSRSRDSRREEPREAGSGDETEDGAPYHHPDPPIKRVDSRLAQKRRRTNLLPDSGASRRQLSTDIHVGSPWWYPALARLFCLRSCSSNALRKYSRAPAWHIPYRQPTARRRYSTIDNTVGDTSLVFRRFSCSCC